MKLWQIWQLFAYWGHRKGGDITVRVKDPSGAQLAVTSVEIEKNTLWIVCK